MNCIFSSGNSKRHLLWTNILIFLGGQEWQWHWIAEIRFSLFVWSFSFISLKTDWSTFSSTALSPIKHLSFYFSINQSANQDDFLFCLFFSFNISLRWFTEEVLSIVLKGLEFCSPRPKINKKECCKAVNFLCLPWAFVLQDLI